MATIRLIPSTYAVSSTSYLSVSNAQNMYTNTDSTTYATITNTYASTSSRYLYLRGFNFSDIPSAAVISSFTVKIKGYEGGLATSTSYAPRLANGTSAISNTTASSNFGTSTTTITIPTGALTWQQIVNYGSNFTIMVYVRRASRNTTGYFYCYGAEIEVTYTVPDPRTITSTISGNGTISPSGANTYYDGDEYELIITPTTKTDTVTATQDGVDITSQLVAHGAGGEQTASAVLGTYSLKSGGFNGSGASYFQGLVGKGHTASQTTSNYYSSSSSTQAVFQYAIDLGNIPSNAIITNLYMIANGHAESTSQSSEYMCVQLKSGSAELSEKYNFKSHGTSNGDVTVEAETLPTVAQLDDLVVEMTLGYYGGAVNGVTVYLEYEVPSGEVDHYTYTYIVSGNSTIAVVIGSAATGDRIYLKQNGTWKESSNQYVKVSGSWRKVAKVWKKVSGSWVEQADKSALFNASTSYINGSNL